MKFKIILMSLALFLHVNIIVSIVFVLVKLFDAIKSKKIIIEIISSKQNDTKLFVFIKLGK